MKKRIWAILLFSGLAIAADITPTPPTVRDAYVQHNDLPNRTVRLKDSLNVVFCKAEYDGWARGQSGAPLLSLYIDGKLMKGLEQTKPNLVVGAGNVKDTDTEKVNVVCAKASADGLALLEKDSADKTAAAKDAAVKADAETDVALRSRSLSS